MPQKWTAEELVTFLVDSAGLPPEDAPTGLGVTFTEIGLDSLAYLQLQSEVQERFGLELPADPPEDFTLAEILATVNGALSQREVA